MGVLLQFFPLHKSENQGSVMFSNSPKAGTEDREAWCGGISGGQSGDRNRTRYFDAQDGWPGIRLSPGQWKGKKSIGALQGWQLQEAAGNEGKSLELLQGPQSPSPRPQRSLRAGRHNEGVLWVLGQQQTDPADRVDKQRCRGCSQEGPLARGGPDSGRWPCPGSLAATTVSESEIKCAWVASLVERPTLYLGLVGSVISGLWDWIPGEALALSAASSWDSLSPSPFIPPPVHALSLSLQ